MGHRVKDLTLRARPEFDTTVRQVFSNMVLGKETVDQAIANAKPKFQAILDKPIA